MKHFSLIILLFLSIAASAQNTCSSCGGYGKFRCNTCGGSGAVIVQVWNSYYGVYQNVSQRCATCNGYGVLLCSTCGGRGYVSSSGPSFKGKHCTETVGCSCPGFSPIKDGEVWKQAYCKHCGHKQSNHK